MNVDEIRARNQMRVLVVLIVCNTGAAWWDPWLFLTFAIAAVIGWEQL